MRNKWVKTGVNTGKPAYPRVSAQCTSSFLPTLSQPFPSQTQLWVINTFTSVCFESFSLLLSRQSSPFTFFLKGGDQDWAHNSNKHLTHPKDEPYLCFFHIHSDFAMLNLSFLPWLGKRCSSPGKPSSLSPYSLPSPQSRPTLHTI